MPTHKPLKFYFKKKKSTKPIGYSSATATNAITAAVATDVVATPLPAELVSVLRRVSTGVAMHAIW